MDKRIASQEQDRHTPFIACTANGDSYKGQCLEAGMDDFTLKPIMLDDQLLTLSFIPN